MYLSEEDLESVFDVVRKANREGRLNNIVLSRDKEEIEPRDGITCYHFIPELNISIDVSDNTVNET